MKLGVVLVTIAGIVFIAWAVVLAMSLIMGDYFSAVWMTIYTSIAGGLSLYSGVKRLRKAKRGVLDG